MSVLEAKFSKWSSQKLLEKLEKNQGTEEELVVIHQVLERRGVPKPAEESVAKESLAEESPGEKKDLSPEQVQAVENKITEIIEKNHRPTLTRLLEILGGVEDYEKLSEEQAGLILEVKIGEEPAKESKENKYSPPTKGKTLSKKDSEEISKALKLLELERADKKMIITTLLKAGFTRGQLKKYTPTIAAGVYIYKVSKQLEAEKV